MSRTSAMCSSTLLLVILVTYLQLVISKRDVDAEKNPQFWKNIAQEELEMVLRSGSMNKNKAKNVILFLGDGMGISTVTAGRIYKAQKRRTGGAEMKLAMDQFPHAALSRTYSTDNQVSDSAATATAFLCGVKTNRYMLGVNSAAQYKNCQSSKGNEVDSVLVDFYNAGKSTGLVSTTRLNHATPGAAYAHTPSRRWYGDADLPIEAVENGCKDIAMQLYESSHMMTVLLGGGRKYFQPNTSVDPEYPAKNSSRLDGNDLIQMWKKKMSNAGYSHQYVWNKRQFDGVDPTTTDRLLGLFERKDMHYEARRHEDTAGEPSLAEMTQKAIEMLQKNENGYFLLVEGGRIDHGHHANIAYLALNDLVAFDDAIEKAVNMTSEEDTLIIVTADHSHVFTMGGYASRENDILGLAPSNSNPEIVLDGKPYTTLLYANGPGFKGYHDDDDDDDESLPLLNYTERRNVSEVNTTAPDYLQESAVPRYSETHGGEDVAIAAKGPMSHLFQGVHEQHYIAHVIRYAACVGSLDRNHCTSHPESMPDNVKYLGRKVSTVEAENIMRIQFAYVIISTSICIMLSLLLVLHCRKAKAVQN